MLTECTLTASVLPYASVRDYRNKIGSCGAIWAHVHNFWKSSDPGDPEVEDTRKRLAGMKMEEFFLEEIALDIFPKLEDSGANEYLPDGGED